MIEHETAQLNPSTYAPTLTIAHLVAENENLRRKLETQPVIEQAKGILMGCHGVSADDAFDLLRRWSQDTNTKLHQVAQTIVDGRRRGDPLGWRMPHEVQPALSTSTKSRLPRACLRAAHEVRRQHAGPDRIVGSLPPARRGHRRPVMSGLRRNRSGGSRGGGDRRRPRDLRHHGLEICRARRLEGLASLRQVMAEAEAHRVRMQSRSGAV